MTLREHRHRRPFARRVAVPFAARVTAHLLVVVVALACSTGTEPGTPRVQLLGSWRYEAAQLSPMPATLEGSLEIEGQDGDAFGGSFDVIESSAAGSRRVTGIVTGIALDAATLDFDVFVDGVARRHVGELRGDTIEGAWMEVRTGGASGSFRAERAEVP